MIELSDAIRALRQYAIDHGRQAGIAVVTAATHQSIVDQAVIHTSNHNMRVDFEHAAAYLCGVRLKVVAGDENLFDPQPARNPLIFGAST